MLKNLIFKLGSDPHKSWSDFRLGLGIFVVGVALLYVGAVYWIWLQIPGIAILALGFAIAAKGYLGIFANRFAQTLNRLNSVGKKGK